LKIKRNISAAKFKCSKFLKSELCGGKISHQGNS
jgi:hypothetical protein